VLGHAQFAQSLPAVPVATAKCDYLAFTVREDDDGYNRNSQSDRYIAYAAT
jgi:hypothetical protein